MKRLDEIQSFIQHYVEATYKIECDQFDNSVSGKEHYRNAQNYLEYFFANHYRMIKSGGISSKNDNLSEDELQQERDSILKQDIYVIRIFDNARFGTRINSDNKTLYTYILGRNSKWFPEGMYSENIDIGEVSGELKIISIRNPVIPIEFNNEGRIIWKYGDRSVEKRDGYTILDEGDILTSVSINPPSDQYLQDFEFKL